MRRWFSSRRTYTKILFAVVIAIAGTIATGALSLAGIRQLQQTRNVEVGQAMPYITALNRVALDAKTAANDEREYLNTGDPAFRDKALSRQYTIKAALADALATATDATGRAATEEIQTAVDEWFAAVRVEFATYETDPQAAAAASRGENYNLRMTYEAMLITELYRAERALVAGKSFGDTAVRTRNSLVVLIAVALAVAVFLAFHIAWVRRAVADGDHTQDAGIDHDRRDEVGEMAEALRRATSTLQTTVAKLDEHAGVLASASEKPRHDEPAAPARRRDGGRAGR